MFLLQVLERPQEESWGRILRYKTSITGIPQAHPDRHCQPRFRVHSDFCFGMAIIGGIEDRSQLMNRYEQQGQNFRVRILPFQQDQILRSTRHLDTCKPLPSRSNIELGELLRFDLEDITTTPYLRQILIRKPESDRRQYEEQHQQNLSHGPSKKGTAVAQPYQVLRNSSRIYVAGFGSFDVPRAKTRSNKSSSPS